MDIELQSVRLSDLEGKGIIPADAAQSFRIEAKARRWWRHGSSSIESFCCELNELERGTTVGWCIFL